MANTDPSFAAGKRVRGRLDRVFAPMGKARDALGSLGGRLAAAPVNFAGDAVGNALLGRKNLSGSRLRPVKGGPGKGMKEITPAEADLINSGKSKGKVIKARIAGRTHYYKRKFRPGGAAGAIMRNPGKSTAAAALAYYLMRSPKTRQMAGAGARGMRPTGDFDPAVLARFQSQPSHENPLTKGTWG